MKSRILTYVCSQGNKKEKASKLKCSSCTPARKDPISQEFASDVVHIFAAVQNVIGKELNISDEEYPQFLEDLRKGMTEKPDAMWSHGVCLGQKPH